MPRKIIYCLVLILLVNGFLVEPYQVSLTTLDLRGKRVAGKMKGLIAVHLTDLHIQEIGHREKQVISMIRDLSPDLIFLTGDFVKWRGDYSAAMAFLKELHARYGVYAVLGDYDTSDSRKSCLFCHDNGNYRSRNRSHDVTFLKDEVLTVPIDTRVIQIGGSGFAEDFFKKPLQHNLKACPQILLCHNPLSFDRVSDQCETLLLSGDTHGGQILLPSFAWRILGYEKNARYNDGVFSKGAKMMFVSRGIGTSHLPFRLFCKPEVVAIYF